MTSCRFNSAFVEIFGCYAPKKLDKATDKIWVAHGNPMFDAWQRLWNDVAILANECLKDSNGIF